MKKIYAFLFALAAGSLPGYAQLTLQSSDLPVPGLAFTLANNDTMTGPIPAGGAAQTWNYASLSNVYTDTVGFIAAAGTPSAALVPSANLATHDPSTGTYAYFTSSASGFYQNGASDSAVTGGFAELDPPQLFVRTPFTYLDTTSSDARMEV